MIEIHNLSKTYPDGTVALDGVDLAFGDGMLGLLGPNGAGKTTLLSVLVLAQEPSAGRRVYFGIEDTVRNRPKIRSMIGYLPQDFLPITGLSGLEYLQYCAELRGVPLSRKDLRRRAWALLEAVELDHSAQRRAETYSGGMQRRLGLAQALIHGPRLLVVDEPTAGLDPEERIRFRNLITELAEQIPVLLSTHIVEDIEATCPRLAIIARGKLLFDGAPGEIMERAEGRLWRLPVEQAVPAGVRRLGQRIGEGVKVDHVLYSEDSVPGAQKLRPQLEEACAAFLAVEADVQLLDTEDLVDAQGSGSEGERE
jgi:ABC-type multidrug transport system ATPase subunit